MTVLPLVNALLRTYPFTGHQVAEYANYIDILGGHPEPAHLLRDQPSYEPKSITVADIYNFLSSLDAVEVKRRVKEELFHSLLDEIQVFHFARDNHSSRPLLAAFLEGPITEFMHRKS
jgi:hypothetical protein